MTTFFLLAIIAALLLLMYRNTGDKIGVWFYGALAALAAMFDSAYVWFMGLF